MDEAEDRLKALFALDEPPARDVVFSAEVMARVLRREFRIEVATVGAASLVGAAALWAVWPVLQPALVAISHGLAPTIAGLALAACLIAVLQSRPLTAES
ncbi:hypothetical protein [Phenylobacterium sp. J367]|uniref:hypothetical protein n=1 Tax=Phenylobacterium sp. J367 TaxID=2898435 RepID=UPI002151BB1D|nr:hypothetical protein [Phenylobacterium sp. J367]MCR5880275.1 hypothetical protein [Phenylobacterium sp. J367]